MVHDLVQSNTLLASTGFHKVRIIKTTIREATTKKSRMDIDPPFFHIVLTDLIISIKPVFHKSTSLLFIWLIKRHHSQDPKMADYRLFDGQYRTMGF